MGEEKFGKRKGVREIEKIGCKQDTSWKRVWIILCIFRQQGADRWLFYFVGQSLIKADIKNNQYVYFFIDRV